MEITQTYTPGAGFFEVVQTLLKRHEPSVDEMQRVIAMLNRRIGAPSEVRTTPRQTRTGSEELKKLRKPRKDVSCSPSRSPVALLRGDEDTVEYKVFQNGDIQKDIASMNFIRLYWKESPGNVLLIKKPGVPEVTEKSLEVIEWLHSAHGVVVTVEPQSLAELGAGLGKVNTWRDGKQMKSMLRKIDFVICLGGDGTLLWVNTLFPEAMPPVLSFAMGSLGFLTSFCITDFPSRVNAVLSGGCHLSLRSRLLCKIYRQGKLEVTYLALNEVCVDRGNSPFLTDLSCFIDDLFLTDARADGLIVSTSTGSTAYSLSAGGSLMHPEVHGFQLTPVCPHSLSFRPVVFPDCSKLTIKPNSHSRGTAWVSCDGKNRVELCEGDFVEICSSRFPFPLVCNEQESQDWIHSVVSNLHWNTRG